MAGKRSGRTSKTDHVLSLLAGAGVDREGTSSAPVDKEEVSPTPVGRESPAAQPKAETTAAPVQPTAPERHLAPPILEVARLHNEALSETIREALTQTLEQELDQAEQEDAPVPSAKGEGAAEEHSLPEEEPVMQQPLTSEEASAMEEIPEEAPAEEKDAPPEGKVLPDGSVFLHVMEYLVEERLEKYVKLFGLCSCQRCLADVRALALSRLPAKYVVLPSSSVTPMLSLYQAKFDSMVIAEVIQACKSVMENPRHLL